MVGQTVGKYRVVSRLGRGGMGTVYKAIDETLDREVAIKCLNADLGDPDLLKRFRAEAVTLARLNHPNIATLFELEDHDGQMMMVMEFVRGETFDVMSQREGPMDLSRATQLCAQVLDALDHAHRAGVVHRDLKPANLMLTHAGLVKVMDFGLARMVGTERLTNDGYMVGTPAYMSPEQVLGRDIDGRSDLYAMGVVLFRLLTSQLPFKAESGIAMVQRQLHDPPTPVRQVRSELPPVCEEVLARALEKAADNRYQTADEFRSALTRLDPTLVAPSASRVSSYVAPAPAPAVALGADTTIRQTPTPMAAPVPSTVEGPAEPSPVTLVLPREAGRPVAPARAMASRGAIAASTVLLAGIIVTGLLVWRSRPGAPPPAAVAAPATASASPSVAPPSVSPAAAETKSAAPLVSPKPGPDAAKKAVSKASLSTAAPPLVRADLPVVIFNRMKLLMLGGDKPRDTDVTLRLAADGFEVLSGARALETAVWLDVIGLYHSHSREPRWTNALGQSGPVAKAGGGGFGFLKGTPDWITVRTKRNFVPLRVRDDDLPRLTSELEARTGAKVVRVK